jgi:hypothetical protein
VRALDLTGLQTPEFLEQVTALQIRGPIAKYEWFLDGLYCLRPAQFRNNRSVALNRVVSKFESNTTNLMDTLLDVLQIFDPKPVRRLPPRSMPARVVPFVSRSTRISLSQVPIRSVLNAIAREHGSMSWLIEYADVSGGPAGMKLSFVGFDKWTLSGKVSR